MLVSWRRWLILVSLIIFQVLGFLLFIKGFFPSKVVLPGPGETHLGKGSTTPAVYDKVIFMVVDAMRSDFMFSRENSNMPFVHELIRSGEALGFTAFSNPPTVTLPRLKGITTGSTPNFLDAILNIADDDTSSTLGDQDSWVRQLYTSGKHIHMFGDDTWIKLFPTYFDKFEGTSSFYVSDFTQVDQNVTRHIDSELNDDDSWDCLILHYLGLDHIGHKGGPSSPNMPIKQREMDGIIAKLYKEYVQKHDNTLLVVLGDHGMNEVGNHGGSSVGETSAALLAVSNKLSKLSNSKRDLPLPLNDELSFYTQVQQIDLVPTLATLLNFPIPKNNLGVFIDDFKDFYSKSQYVDILLENAYQLKELVENSFGKNFTKNVGDGGDDSFDGFSKLWSQLQSSKDEADIKLFLNLSQLKLAESATNYDYNSIKLGVGLFVLCSILFILCFLESSKITNNMKMGGLFIGGSVLVALSNFGSSLVEEEYQIWWWILTLYFMGLIIYLKPPHLVWNFIAILLLLRMVRGWNNSGQKFNLLSNLKIGKFLDDKGWNVNLIPIFYCFYLFFIFRKSGYFKVFEDFQVVTFLPIFTLIGFSLVAKLITIYVEDEAGNASNFNTFILAIVTWPKDLLQVNEFKDCLNPIYNLFYYVFVMLILVRFGWSLINYQPVLHRMTFFSDFTNIFMVLLLNQSSPRNVLLYGVFLSIRYLFGKMLSTTLYNGKTQNMFRVSLIFTSFNILVQNLSFFGMGNTNSLSTVDLTNAFNGLADYDLILCGLLTFCANWAGPIFWSLSYLIMVLENAQFLHKYKYDLLYYKMLISMTLYSIVGIGLLVACVSLRFHLFIWTVFSPKLLYFGSWYIFMNLGVDFLVSLILIWFY